MNVLLRTCRSQRPRWPRTGSLQRLSFFRLPRTIPRVGDHNFFRFGVNTHSSHRFGLSARTAPALTRLLPFASGCVLHLCLLDFKAVIFASHKLHSRLLAHDSRNELRIQSNRRASRSWIVPCLADPDSTGRLLSGCGEDRLQSGTIQKLSGRSAVTRITRSGSMFRTMALLAFVTSSSAQTATQGTKVVSGRLVIEGAAVRPPTPVSVPSSGRPDKLPTEISDAEFWRMISEFSEPGGAYPYENFVSNEWNQQKIIPALKSATRAGEVYIGVGPEQNFTYAAALRAKMAFVLDIRRQNMLELLLYKALFELAPTRADFVSRLFSRKRPAGLDDKTSATALFAAYEKVASNADLYMENLGAIKSSFKTHGYSLSSDDITRIEFVYQVFFRGGPAINYSFASISPATSTPSYLQNMTMSDDAGHHWSYLATEENFQYVRELQRKNLFVPLVGDFSGPTTIRSIARYLKEKNANVSAFYASNVESYLDEKQTTAFYANLLSLPIDSTTTTIRYVDFMHNTVLPWWISSLSYIQVVSPMSDLANLSRAGNMPTYNDVLRLIKDPSLGGTVSRFVLPMSQGPGQPFLSITIEPQPGGTFQTRLPVGLTQVGAAIGLPAAFRVKSITYGSTDLLGQSLNVSLTETAELVITLTKSAP